MTDATWRLTGKPFGSGGAAGYRKTSSISRHQAMKALGSVVYAARLADGTVKIGWTENFEHRLAWLKGYVKQDVELLAFKLGTYEDEQAIHASLTDHLDHAREYYKPTPEVMAVVNDMRADLKMPPVAA